MLVQKYLKSIGEKYEENRVFQKYKSFMNDKREHESSIIHSAADLDFRPLSLKALPLSFNLSELPDVLSFDWNDDSDPGLWMEKFDKISKFDKKFKIGRIEAKLNGFNRGFRNS